MFAVMLSATVAFFTIVGLVGLMAWVGDRLTEAREEDFALFAEDTRPRRVVGGTFFDLGDDEPTDEVPADRRGAHPAGICPPLYIEESHPVKGGLVVVMKNHLSERYKATLRF
jgi:hypothetical protein